MKANEFVKQYGIEKAKLLLSTQGKTIAELKGEYTAKQLKEYQGYIVSGDLMSFVELKRIFESWELVQEFGDNESYLKNYLTKNPEAKGFYLDSWCQTFTRDRLEQAIADMESCND